MDDTSLMLEKVGKEGMALWSESNKKDFVKTFNDRVLASRYILQATATVALKSALDKKYIGEKQARKLYGDYGSDRWNGSLISSDFGDRYSNDRGFVGERNRDELRKIAEDRADEILKQLPPLQKAVQILSADLAKKISERDGLVEQGKKLTEELVELSQPIAMAEVDQKMTVGAFRKMVKDIEKKRTNLINKINEITENGLELDKEINKALYSGLPGLSDAVIAAIVSMMEKAKALSQMGRRVGEQVMFGNSEAALELLRRFEQDETALSDEVKVELSTAMDKLKLAVANKKKLKK